MPRQTRKKSFGKRKSQTRKKYETYKGKQIIIPNVKNWDLVSETDRFSLRQRLACTIVPGKTPMELWTEHPEWTLNDLEQHTRICSLYPFPVGMEILHRFKPKRWLDPCAGWGDRLRCATAYGVPYVGVDTNLNMQSAYKMIVDERGQGKHYKYKVLPGKFQDVKIKGKFDLVFTSPPFYTFEVYDSMNAWKSVDDFLDNFLYILLEKANAHLSKHGHLILYIEDKPENPYIQKMKDYVTEHIPSLRYEGVIYYQGRPSPISLQQGRIGLRPYFIWKKV